MINVSCAVSSGFMKRFIVLAIATGVKSSFSGRWQVGWLFLFVWGFPGGP